MKKAIETLNRFGIEVGIFLFAMVYFSFFWKYGINTVDEGFVIHGCQRILRGDMPYVDFYLDVTPLGYYIQAFIFKIFGETLIVGRISMAFVGSIIASLIYCLGKKVMPKSFSLIPSLIFIFWSMALINYPWYDWYALTFALLTLLGISSFIKTAKPGYLFVSGFLCGTAIACKQNLGAATFIACVIFLFVINFVRDEAGNCHTAKQRLLYIFKSLIIFVIGAISPFILLGGYYYFKGHIDKFIYYIFYNAGRKVSSRIDLFRFPPIKPPSLIILLGYIVLVRSAYLAKLKAKKRALLWFFGLAVLVFVLWYYYAFISSRGITYLTDLLKKGSINGFFNLPALSYILVAVILIRRLLKKASFTEQHRHLLVFLLFGFLYTWFCLFMFGDYLHILFAIPSGFLLVGYLFYWTRERLCIFLKCKTLKFTSQSSLVRFCSIYAVILPLVFICATGFKATRRNEVFRSIDPPLCKMTSPLDLKKGKGIFLFKQDAEDIKGVVDYIQLHTQPEDRIFVTYIDTMLYFLSDRNNASYFSFFHSEDFISEWQDSVINDLDRYKVKLIIMRYERYVNRFNNLLVPEKNPSKYRIHKYIEENYSLKEKFGRYCVLLKNESKKDKQR